MKRFLTLLLASLTLWAAGCTKTVTPPPAKNPTIELGVEEVAFLFDETTAAKAKEVKVTLTDLEDFNADIEYNGTDKDWLQVTKTKSTNSDGSTKDRFAILEALSVNTAVASERTATLVISAEGAVSKSINVRQGYRGEVLLSLAEKEHSFKWNQTNEPYSIAVTTNATDLTASSDAAWLEASANLQTKTVSLLVKESNAAASRKTNVTVTAEGKSETIVVTQLGFAEDNFALTPSKTALGFTAAVHAEILTATTTVLPVKYELDDAAKAWISDVTIVEEPAVTGLLGELRTVTITLTNTRNETAVKKTGVLTLRTAYTDPNTGAVTTTTAQIALSQDGMSNFDIAGEWNWEADSAPMDDDRTLSGDPTDPDNLDQNGNPVQTYVVNDGWVKASQHRSGTATIIEVPGGWAITGIKGVNLNTGLNLSMHLSTDGTNLLAGGVTQPFSELMSPPPAAMLAGTLFDVALYSGAPSQANFRSAYFNGKKVTTTYKYLIEHEAIVATEQSPYSKPAWTEHLEGRDEIFVRSDAAAYPVTITTEGDSQKLEFLRTRQLEADVPNDGGLKTRTYNITYNYFTQQLPMRGSSVFGDGIAMEHFRNIVLTRTTNNSKR